MGEWRDSRPAGRSNVQRVTLFSGHRNPARRLPQRIPRVLGQRLGAGARGGADATGVAAADDHPCTGDGGDPAQQQRGGIQAELVAQRLQRIAQRRVRFQQRAAAEWRPGLHLRAACAGGVQGAVIDDAAVGQRQFDLVGHDVQPAVE